ncbi:MAG TPA: DMT family transporter [Ferrovibrio sp.]|uniref:aromatic amino acid exporter YddG n=1 Tax=Ferrovibrio sp. TaxID=1917215 RepID=UPI002ED1BC15
MTNDPAATAAAAQAVPPAGQRKRATLIGALAILLWAALAVLTAYTPSFPALQVNAMSFTVASIAALILWRVRGDSIAGHLKQPPRAWALGVGGLLGYHALYFAALKLAPPLEASLINYLWPLLIVVLSGLLPGERLRWFHVAGAALGLAGTVNLVLSKGSIAFDPAHLAGYGAALAAALTWSSYSVLSRRLASVPTDAVGGFCMATALLSWLLHFAFETTVLDAGPIEWLAVLGLGLGPAGLAFFFWDHGMKRGDIRALGSMAYAAPLLSTFLLILFGQGQLTWPVAAACGLIVIGALLGTSDLRRKPAAGGQGG